MPSGEEAPAPPSVGGPALASPACSRRLDFVGHLSRWAFKWIVTSDTKTANSLLDARCQFHNLEVQGSSLSGDQKIMWLLNSGRSGWMSKCINYLLISFGCGSASDSDGQKSPALFLNFLGDLPVGVSRSFKFFDGKYGFGWVHEGRVMSKWNFSSANADGDARRETHPNQLDGGSPSHPPTC